MQKVKAIFRWMFVGPRTTVHDTALALIVIFLLSVVYTVMEML